MGYGKKTLEILSRFFEGDLINLDEKEVELEDFFPTVPKTENSGDDL